MYATKFVPLLAGGILLLAACGGDSNSDSNGTQQANPNGTSAANVGSEEFGMTDEELVDVITQTEAAIASCMEDAGFEYVPIDPVTFRGAMDSLTAVPGLTDQDFVAQYGYGLTTLPPTQAFGHGEQNNAIFDGLSAADKVAYQRTLVGENTDATFVIMLENEDLEPAGGCTKTAIDDVFSDEQRNPNFANPFDELVKQDQRMIDALKTWSDCMSESGYEYEDPEDAEAELLERYASITEGADPATLTGDQKDALTALQGEEIAVAAADLECSEGSGKLFQVEAQVERDISGRTQN